MSETKILGVVELEKKQQQGLRSNLYLLVLNQEEWKQEHRQELMEDRLIILKWLSSQAMKTLKNSLI